MKRILVPALILAGIAIVSCKKTEPVAPAEPGSCTISGTVKADLDLSNDTLADGTFIAGLESENAPAGINITFIVNSGDLDANPEVGYDYQDLSYTAAVTDGEYTVTLPAISTPYTVDVYFDDFNEEQRQFTPGDVTFESKKFFLGTMSVSGISDGVTKVENFVYNY